MPKLNIKERNQETDIEHSGIPGMKWYERRYQNYDGSLTEEGRKHYGVGPPRMTKEERKQLKEEKKTEKLNKKKEKIYIRGDSKEIYKNRKLFTTDEYQKAMQRAELFDKYSKNTKDVKPSDGGMQTGKLYIKGNDRSNAEKLKIINSGNAKLVSKNIGKLNDQELKSALEHVKIKAELKDKKYVNKIEKAQKDRNTTKNGAEMTQKLIKGVGMASDLFKKGTEAYNNYNFMAASVNEMLGSDTLPVFQATGTNFKSFNDQIRDRRSSRQTNSPTGTVQVSTNSQQMIDAVGSVLSNWESGSSTVYDTNMYTITAPRWEENSNWRTRTYTYG